MQLFYAPTTIAVAVAITMEEAGVPYDTVLVDITKEEHASQAYGEVNPNRRVPALRTSEGTLTETGAMLDFVAALKPDVGLVPSDPMRAARMREVMYYLASTMHVNHAHKMRGRRWANEKASLQDMRSKVTETMTASCQHIETHRLRGPFVLGDQISLADPYLYVICSWLEGDGVDVSAFPKIIAFLAAMEARTSVQSVKAKGMI